MAATLTHFLVMKKYFEKEGKEISFDNKNENYATAFLGSTGPDKFYMAGDFGYISNFHHYKNPGRFIQEIYKIKTENNSEIIYYYIKGFLSHMATDLVIHPFVNSLVGKYQEHIVKRIEIPGPRIVAGAKSLSSKFFAHNIMEFAQDYYVFDKIFKKNKFWESTKHEVLFTYAIEEKRGVIADFLKKGIEKTYSIEISKKEIEYVLNFFVNAGGASIMPFTNYSVQNIEDHTDYVLDQEYKNYKIFLEHKDSITDIFKDETSTFSKLIDVAVDLTEKMINEVFPENGEPNWDNIIKPWNLDTGLYTETKFNEDTQEIEINFKNYESVYSPSASKSKEKSPLVPKITDAYFAKKELGSEEYTVVSGDILSKIATHYEGVTYNEIAEYNHLASANDIVAGQKLRIPIKGEQEEAEYVKLDKLDFGAKVYLVAKIHGFNDGDNVTFAIYENSQLLVENNIKLSFNGTDSESNIKSVLDSNYSSEEVVVEIELKAKNEEQTKEWKKKFKKENSNSSEELKLYLKVSSSSYDAIEEQSFLVGDEFVVKYLNEHSLKPDWDSGFYHHQKGNDGRYLDSYWKRGYAPSQFYYNKGEFSELASCKKTGQKALGNCTWYATARARELGGNVSYGSWGNAKGFDEHARKRGVRMNNNPAVGSIAQHNRGTWGHVAVVEKVNNNGTILISESSYAPCIPSWNFLHRRRTVKVSYFDNYIHVERG